MADAVRYNCPTATPPVEMPGEQTSDARAQDSAASGIAPPATPADRQEENGLLPFFPNYVLDAVIAWYILLGLLIFLASLLPAGLEETPPPPQSFASGA